MDIKCSKTDLIYALNLVQKTNAENLLLELCSYDLTIAGNSLEMGIFCTMPVVEKSESSDRIVVNSKVFGEIVRKLPDCEVRIETEDNVLKINSGKAKFTIVLSNEEYPPISFIDESNSVLLKNCKQAIKQTVFASEQADTGRPMLQGVLIDSKAFVALDGSKMAVKRIETGVNDVELIVPAKVLIEILKLPEENILMSYSDKQVMFTTEDKRAKFITRLINGSFVQYEQLLKGKVSSTVINVGVAELVNSLERSVLVATDNKKYPVVLTVKDTVLNISTTADKGFFSEDIELKDCVGKELTIGFNAKNLITCLKAVETETVEMNMGSELQPCFIEGDDYTFLVMPVRLANNF